MHLKLETITIEGTEYYQFVNTQNEHPWINAVGDIFSVYCTTKKIEEEREKFINQYSKYYV